MSALQAFDHLQISTLVTNHESVHRMAEVNYTAKVYLQICNSFPYNKPALCKLLEEQVVRKNMIATGLWSVFYFTWPFMVVPEEIVNLITGYTLLYESIDEIFDHLDYYQGERFNQMLHQLWAKMVDAQLYRTVGWFPEPEPNWIRNKYFYLNHYGWRKTFHFGGVIMTFAQCVMKRLYLIKNNVVYSHFRRCTVALNYGLQGFYYVLKEKAQSKKKRRTKRDDLLELIRLLRMYKERVLWIEQVVSKICEHENKTVNPNLTWRQHACDYPTPKVIH